MKIELKNIKEHKGLSQETPAYTARVYVDGKPAVDVSNDGHGGCDYQYAIKGAAHTVEEINDWCKANLPKIEFGDDYPPMDQDLELWCHAELGRQDSIKWVKSQLRRNIIVNTGEKVVAWTKKKKGRDIERLIRDQVAKKYPDGTILNDGSLDDALAVLVAS